MQALAAADAPVDPAATDLDTVVVPSSSVEAANESNAEPTAREVIEQVESIIGHDMSNMISEHLRPVSHDQLRSLRTSTADQIRHQQALPRGLRELLANLAIEQGESTGGKLLLPIDATLSAMRSAVPRAFLLSTEDLDYPEHHAGEKFFSGKVASDELTDDEADQIARAQLERTGFRRK